MHTSQLHGGLLVRVVERAEFFRLCEEYRGTIAANEQYVDNLHWQGGIKAWDAIDLAKRGDLSKVQALESSLALPDQTETQPRSVMTCHGAISVPHALSGHPTYARSRKRQEQESFGTMVISGIFSSDVRPEDAMRRCSRILKLMQDAATDGRSLDLYVMVDCYSIRQEPLLIRLPSRPLDLATIGFILGHVSFSRGPLIGVQMGLCGSENRGHFGPIIRQDLTADVRHAVGDENAQVWQVNRLRELERP